jgi:NAD(P)H-nitrite reductase large subunit
MSYVIIGSGAAGVSAVEAIRSLDPEGVITLISEDPDLYYSRPGLAYFLTGELPESQLFPYRSEDFRQMGVQLITAAVESIDTAKRCIQLDDGRQLSYQKLLLATGAQARDLQVPGADLEGVVKLDNIQDARDILKKAGKARAAVVVGGGITALEIVEGLVARGLQVHYLLRGERYWSNVLDETESKLVLRRLVHDGIQIHKQTEIAAILPAKKGLLNRSGNRVGAVRTKAGDLIPCQMVGLAVGVVPRAELARQMGLDLDEGVIVDDGMRTSDPNVFAAGDVARSYDPFVQKAMLDVLWPSARDQGQVAGCNMAGGTAIYTKHVPINVTRLAGVRTTIIGNVGSRDSDPDLTGLARGDSQTWREARGDTLFTIVEDVNRVRLTLGEKTLRGALIMGDQRHSPAIQQIIAQQIDISAIRDDMVTSREPISLLLNHYEQVRS